MRLAGLEVLSLGKALEGPKAEKWLLGLLEDDREGAFRRVECEDFRPRQRELAPRTRLEVFHGGAGEGVRG